MISEPLLKVLQYIDTYRERFVDDLREAVAFRTVSGSYEHNADIMKMIKWTEGWLKKLKCTTTERFDIGSYAVDGKTIKLPTVILSTFGKDTKKKTVCVYCRIDVKNADVKQWNTDPWLVTEKDGRLYGRGTCKGKTPLLSWFHCIEAFLNERIPLPVNVKFIIEAMSEMNCFGLEDFLYTQRLTFLRNIDFICVNESEWLNQKIPCISYAACGICHYELSARFTGGTIGNVTPSELVDWLFSHFVDSLGNILIPKLNDRVSQVNPEGEQALDNVVCDLTDIKKTLPDYMQSWSKQKILMRMWRFPALVGQPVKSVDDDGEKGRRAATKRFFVKIVSAQSPIQCTQCLLDHIETLIGSKFSAKEYAVTFKRGKGDDTLKCTIANGKTVAGTVECKTISATRPWHENSVSPHYVAAKKAVTNIYKYSANMIRESTDIPILLILGKVI